MNLRHSQSILKRYCSNKEPASHITIEKQKKIYWEQGYTQTHPGSACTVCSVMHSSERGCMSRRWLSDSSDEERFFVSRKKKNLLKPVRRVERLISDYCQAEGQREERLHSVSKSFSTHLHIQTLKDPRYSLPPPSKYCPICAHQRQIDLHFCNYPNFG